MKKIFFILIYIISISRISAQIVVEKDGLYYISNGSYTFPSHKYTSAKLYRYFVSDQYIVENLTTEQLFEKGKWTEEEKQQYLLAYKKAKKETKRIFNEDIPAYTQQRAIEKMFGLDYKSDKEVLRDSLVLTETTLKELFICLSDSGIMQNDDPTKCIYEFRHQVAFFDENGKEIDRLKICLFCEKIILSSSYFRIYNEMKAIKRLRKYIKRLGIKVTEFGYQVWAD